MFGLITYAEVKEVLGKLPSDKTPDPEEIFNQLHKSKFTLSHDLIELFNASLFFGYHLMGFKELPTIVIRKSQKPRYDTLKSYRFIALLKKRS